MDLACVCRRLPHVDAAASNVDVYAFTIAQFFEFANHVCWCWRLGRVHTQVRGRTWRSSCISVTVIRPEVSTPASSPNTILSVVNLTQAIYIDIRVRYSKACLRMLPVTRYSALRKQDPSGKFRVFSALRAVGLAVELGHKAAQTKGPLAVQTDDLLQVSVAGQLSRILV